MSFAIWGNPDSSDPLRGATSGQIGLPPIILVLASPFLINPQASTISHLLSIQDVIATTSLPAGCGFLRVLCAGIPEPIHREDHPRLVHPTTSSVLGGFLTAIMLAAGQRFLDQELGAARYPDPVHAFVQFLHMAHPGPSIITCTLLRVSSKHCVIQVELARAPTSTEDLDSLPVATLGIFTYGDIRKEKGLSQESRSTITRPPPDRRTECVTINDPVVYATPVTAKMNWVAPRSPDGLWGHRLGGHNRELWLSFRDGSRLSDILHLAYLSDLPLQPPATHIPDFYTKYAISTLCLSIEFKRRPDPSTEWVMIRSNSNKVSNGRYDAALQLFDEKNNLLALSHHVVFTSDLKPRPARM